MPCQGQVLHCKRKNQGCSSAQRQVFHRKPGTKDAVLRGIYRFCSFPLFSAPHSLFSIWTDLKSSEKIPGAPMWWWREWVWITGPSGLHRNSPQGLNIISHQGFDQIRDREIPITLRPHLLYSLFIKNYWPILFSHNFGWRCPKLYNCYRFCQWT